MLDRLNAAARGLRRFSLALAAAALCGVVPTGGALALTVDLTARIEADLRARLQEIDEDLRRRQSGPAVLSDPIRRADLPPPGGPTVVLKSVTFEPGSAFLDEEDLQAIALRYQGKRLDFRGISQLLRDVNDLYAEQGIVTAAAVLEPQDLTDGHLRIRLVEGRVGQVAVVGPHVTDNDFIFRRVRLARGDGVVDVPAAARDIAWFNASSIAQIRLALSPGASFGLTDLALGVTEPKPIQLQFAIDNKGAYSSGEAQMSAVFRRYGLLGRDDVLLFYAAVTEGSRSATGQFDVPISPFGTRLSVNATASSVRVVNGPSVALRIRGNSETLSAALRQPLVVRDQWALHGDLAVQGGENYSTSAGVPILDSFTRKLSAGLRFEFQSERADLRAELRPVLARVRDRLAGSTTDYRILTGTFRGDLLLPHDFLLSGNASWQATGHSALPGNLQLQIGGPTTVRGYPSDGVSGDRGYFGSLELHRRFDLPFGATDNFVFLDFGRAHSRATGATRMASLGVGVTVPVTERGQFEISIAAPLVNSVPGQSDFVISAGLTIAAF